MIRRSDVLLAAVLCILISSVTVFHPKQITGWFGSEPDWPAGVSREPSGESTLSPPPDTRPASPSVVSSPSATSQATTPAFTGTSPVRQVDESPVLETLTRLVSLGSRVPGYPGASRATDEIANRFREMGLQRVTVEPFRVAVPIDSGASVTIDYSGETLALNCLWPNGVRTGTTPPDGVRGHLIDAGNGEFEHLDGRRVEGSIALVGFGSGTSYINPRMLGAGAVIFYDDGKVTRDQASMKFVKIPLEIPRYWAEAQVAARLKALALSEPTASLVARMTWEEAETANVLGYVDGSSELKPGGEHRWNEDLLVISAPYDAISVVPALSPGAENATSIAALLEVARTLTRTPPGYSVLFLATGAHFQGLAGINEFLRRHSRREDYFGRRIAEEERIDYRLFVGIDLSTNSDQVAAFAMGNFYTGWATNTYERDMMAPYARRFAGYLGEGEGGNRPFASAGGPSSAQNPAGVATAGPDASPSLLGQTAASGRNPERPRFVNAIIPSRRVWKDYMPVPLAFDSEAVIFCGQSGITLASPNDPRRLVDTPADSLGALDLANLTRQIETISRIIEAATRDPELFGEPPTGLKDKAYSLTGNVCWFNRDINFALPKDPLSRAVVTYNQAGPVSLAGVRTQMATLTDDRGEFRFDMMRNVGKVKILAYSLDGNGEIAFAPDLGVEGAVDYPIEHAPLWYEDRMVEVLFPSKSLSFFDIVDSRLLAPLDVLTVLGTDNAEPQSYGTDCIPSQSKSTDRAVLGSVVYARPGTRLKVLMSSGLASVKYLLTNADADLFHSPVSVSDVGPLALARAEGEGYEVTGGIIPRSLERSATDMWVIDDVRTRLLTRYSVRNERLEMLHAEARTALDSAQSHLSRRDYSSYMAATRRAAGLENRGYPDVKATASDTTRGVIFYFVLLLPFSFFCERLLFGFVGIPKRIAAFAGIFILVFAILRQVHPAFKLSSSAYVIFVAFVMLSMGSIVLILILSRFGEQIRQSRQNASSGHQDTDIGRVSATAAAVSLGISNLRRRPVRTSLTAVTLVLISFTVLSFTSISTSLRFYRLPRPNPPAYQGILIRDRAWSAFQPFVLEYVETAFRGAGAITVAPRAWYLSPGTRERAHIPFSSTASGAESFAGGLLGMSPAEPAITAIDTRLLPGGRWFREGETDVCILPDDLAAIVGVREQDVGSAAIRLMGRPRRIVGLLRSTDLNRMVDLDNEKLTPYDLVTESAFMNKSGTEDAKLAATAPIQSFTHIESSNTIIVPYEDLLELGGTLQSIAIKPDPGTSAWGTFLRTVEDFVSRVTIPIFVGDSNRVTVYSSIGVASMSGLGQLIVPVLIAALIVFNTMTGSVYERVREIGIYSSVGLAPVHIAALFLAEAAVFATIGAVVGYLIGQVFALSFGTSRLLEGLSLNYSSLSAVSSTVIVMLTVLLSTLYPAKRASDLAVPDVTRRWQFPKPVGDDWRFEFPFTVASADVVGLYSYLTDLFRSYGEGSIGDLLAEEVTLSGTIGDRGPVYVITLKTWLAPYDLGISQYVRLQAQPTEEPSIYDIAMHIHRESGDAESWQRINRGFLKILRKRFLMWRTTPASVRDHHCARGQTLLASGLLSSPKPAQEDNES